MVEIGMRLREERLRAGVKQLDAAAAAGVTRPTISNWEAGRNLPSVLQFKSLIALFGVIDNRILIGERLLELSRENAVELEHAARFFSDDLRRKVDLLLTLLTVASKEGDKHLVQESKAQQPD